jgi:hypothetical protein
MRTTSKVTNTEFPFADDRVAFVFVYNGYFATAPSENDSARGFSHASTRDKKLGLLQNAKECEQFGMYGEGSGKCSLLAVWPGGTRSDVFLVDDLDEALAAF